MDDSETTGLTGLGGLVFGGQTREGAWLSAVHWPVPASASAIHD